MAKDAFPEPASSWSKGDKPEESPNILRGPAEHVQAEARISKPDHQNIVQSEAAEQSAGLEAENREERPAAAGEKSSREPEDDSKASNTEGEGAAAGEAATAGLADAGASQKHGSSTKPDGVTASSRAESTAEHLDQASCQQQGPDPSELQARASSQTHASTSTSAPPRREGGDRVVAGSVPGWLNEGRDSRHSAPGRPASFKEICSPHS